MSGEPNTAAGRELLNLAIIEEGDPTPTVVMYAPLMAERIAAIEAEARAEASGVPAEYYAKVESALDAEKAKVADLGKAFAANATRLIALTDALAPLFDAHGPHVGTPEWQVAFRRAEDIWRGITELDNDFAPPLADTADTAEAAEPCTGKEATWCPVHGTCTCEMETDGESRTLSDSDCPLHGFDSAHAEADR